MALALLCIGLWALIAFKAPMDVYGWLMITATAWFLGFLDAQFFRKWDTKNRRRLTAQSLHETDSPLFNDDSM